MGNFSHPEWFGSHEMRNELYGLSGQTNTLFRIDAVSGAVTVVGSAGQRVAWGLAYDAVTDKIYGLVHPGNDLTLVALAEYDRLTGQATIIGPAIAGVSYTSGLTFDPVRQKVIAFDNSEVRELYAFDPVTGHGELLPVTVQFGGTYGLATDNQGQLIVQANGNILARLDPATGQSSFYLQLSNFVALEGLEFIRFAVGGHDVFLHPRASVLGLDFGNKNVVPSDLSIAVSVPSLEASPVTLTGSFTDPGSFETHLVEIDWGDGTTTSLTLEAGAKVFSSEHSYADNRADGYTVRVTVMDSRNGLVATQQTVNIENVVPVAGLSGPTSGVRAHSLTFNFAATDDSAADQVSAFTYLVNWGDGTPLQTVIGTASVAVSHTYAASGSFNVQVSVTDKDGGASLLVTQSIAITGAALQGTTLLVGGTIGEDSIVLTPNGTSVSVTINGVGQGTFAAPSHIHILGQSGNDNILLSQRKVQKTTTYITAPATIDGGAGSDTVDARGSTANNILLGGDGTDTLYGGSGRDLLIGGLGADTLRGGGGDDILVGGATTFDTNLAALLSLLAEWGRTNISYTARVDHLSGVTSGGLNGINYLRAATILNDSAVDQLYGEGEQDWFLYRASNPAADVLRDRKNNERATVL